MNKPRIVVIGAGAMGRRHIEYVHASGLCELAAICDSDPAAAALAANYNSPFFHSYIEALDLAAPDAAIIASPTPLHDEMTLACIRRGIVPLVEKPIAASLDQARLMVDEAASAAIPLLVGHYRRYHPRIRRLRELVSGGAIGKLIGVSMLWAVKKPAGYFDVPWRTREGGGPVLINLIHEIDSLRYVCGEIVNVYATTGSGARGFAVEDTAAITLNFAAGVVGSIFLSDATPSPWSYELTMFENPTYAHQDENCAYFFGAEGSIAFPKMELWRYPAKAEPGWHSALERECIDTPTIDPLAAQLTHFCGVIARQQQPLVSGEEGVRTLQATLAVLSSARENRPVALPPV